MGWASRGVVGDKWTSRILWVCAFGTAVGLYMTVAERQARNMQKMMTESFDATGSPADGGKTLE